MQQQQQKQQQQRISVLARHLDATRGAREEQDAARVDRNACLASDDASLAAQVVDLARTLTGDVVLSKKKHGGTLVADVLKAHGVQFVFTLSGGHISPILCACEDVGIRVIDVRHEVTTVFAADAVARLTGTPGVAAVTAGPGITNTITAVKNAQMAESPLILLGGAAATLTKNRGALQDVEQMAVLKSVCKASVTVTSCRDVVPALRRMLREAVSGVPGPCFIELPLDVLYPLIEAQAGMGLAERKYKKNLDKTDFDRIMLPIEYKSKKEYLDSLGPLEAVFLENTQSKQPWIVDQYMKFKLRSLFAGAWDDKEFGPLPVDIPLPVASDVDAVAALLAKAQRPVLLLGSQATLGGPEAMKALQAAVEGLGVPTFLGGMARGLLGSKSSTQIRQNRGGALKQADVVILAGTVCDFRLGYGRELPPKAKIISINRGREGATMNMGMFWNAERVCVSDPGLFVRAVAGKMANSGNKQRLGEWSAGLKQAEKKKDEANVKKAMERALGRTPPASSPNGPTQADDDNGPELINPLALLLAVESVLPDNAILVADGGDFVATASYILKPRGPGQWLDPGAFGTLGVGGGFALGAKLVNPDKEVWLVWGDGSCGYSLAEFDTYSKFNLGIVALVGNDAAWTQIEREQVPMFGRNTACALRYLNYDHVAKGYGGAGVTISNPKEDFISVFKDAQRHAKQGVPFLVNALIGRTNFREGSISV